MRFWSFKTWFKILLGIIIFLIAFMYGLKSAAAAVIFQTEEEGLMNADTVIIDADDSAPTSVNLQFGQTLDKTLKYDIGSGQFDFDDDLNVQGNISLDGNITIDGDTVIGSGTGNSLTINAPLGSDFDINQNSLTNLVIHKGTAFPTDPSPADGQMFYRTDTNTLYVHNGTGWDVMNTADGGDAETLDALDSTDFLRSNTSDNVTSGTITFDSGTTLDATAATVNIDDVTPNTFTLDADNTGGNVTLQFGATLAETLTWNNTDGEFEFSDDLNVIGNLDIDGTLIRFDDTAGTNNSRSWMQLHNKDGDNMIEFGSASNGNPEIRFGDPDNTKVGFPESDPEYFAFINDVSEFWLGNTADPVLYFNYNVGDGEWHGTTTNRQNVDYYVGRSGADGFTIDGDLSTTDDVILGASSADSLTVNAKLAADLDFNQFVALKFVVESSSGSFPGGAVEGQFSYRSDLDTLYIYDGAAWDQINNTDADTFDGLDSTSFLRSDGSDSYTSGTLTFDAGTVLDLEAGSVRLDDITSNALRLDADDTGGDVTLQFGTALAEVMEWDDSTSRFRISDDVLVEGGLRIGNGNNGDYLIDEANGIRRTGGYGFFRLGGNANFPQIYMGSSTGAVAAYIDADNGSPLNLNTLEGGNPPVVIGNGGLHPESSSTDIGDSGANRWDGAYITTLDASGAGSFGGDVDFNLNQLGAARLENLSSPPTCDLTTLGRRYFNTGNDRSYICTSVGWKQETNSSGTGTAMFFMDIFGGVRTSMGAGTIAGGNTPVLRADASGNSRVRFSFPVPSDWVDGTDITVEINWSPSDASSGDVHMEFDYASKAAGEVVASGDFTTLTLSQAAPTTTAEIVSTGSTFVIPGSSMAAGDIVFFHLNRDGADAADTYPSDANYHSFIGKYTSK